MIGVSSSGRSFKALGRYLVEGREHTAEGRVAWSSGRNLPTDDPQLAATIMRATASQNVRTSQPMYHLVLSFDPRDAVNRATMERIADRILAELRLREHQTLIVAHADREHAHMHLLINRVHPETGKVWDRWKDYPTIQRVLREEEGALGLRTVDGGLDLAREKEQRDAAQQRRHETERAGEQPEVRERRSRRERDDSFAEIRNDFDTHDRVNELARQRYSTEMEIAAIDARATRIETTVRRIERADAAFDRELQAVYLEPATAKEAFVPTASEIGVSEAERRMREKPEQFGELRTVQRRGFLGRNEYSDAPARESAIAAAARGAELIDARRALVTAIGKSGADLPEKALDGPHDVTPET
jgi:hypothetical protein